MRKPRRKQNLVLFFEENNDSRIIDSNLVRLYMNRFTIHEEAQNEINGVHHLSNNVNQLKGEVEKIKADMYNIIAAATNSNCLYGELSNIHLIIGYHFGLGWGWQGRSPIEKQILFCDCF